MLQHQYLDQSQQSMSFESHQDSVGCSWPMVSTTLARKISWPHQTNSRAGKLKDLSGIKVKSLGQGHAPLLSETKLDHVLE